MKCKTCNGTGEVIVHGDSVTDVCDACGGTGHSTRQERITVSSDVLSEYVASKPCANVECTTCYLFNKCDNMDDKDRWLTMIKQDGELSEKDVFPKVSVIKKKSFTDNSAMKR